MNSISVPKTACTLILASTLIYISGCSILEDVFAKEQLVETVIVPVYEEKPILDEDGDPILNDDGTVVTRKVVVGTKPEVRVKEVPGSRSFAEDAVQTATPFLGPWGILITALTGLATGWATRGRKEKIARGG